MHWLIGLAAVAVLAYVARRVWVEECAAQIATDELLNRPLSFYTNHMPETKRPAGVMDPTGQRDRIADTAATTKSNLSTQV